MRVLGGPRAVFSSSMSALPANSQAVPGTRGGLDGLIENLLTCQCIRWRSRRCGGRYALLGAWLHTQVVLERTMPFTSHRPYIPGFLAFREVDALAALVSQVRETAPHLMPQVRRRTFRIGSSSDRQHASLRLRRVACARRNTPLHRPSSSMAMAFCTTEVGVRARCHSAWRRGAITDRFSR